MRCRTTKLLSQRRRYLAIFFISFYWQGGSTQKKKRLLSQKSPSNGILHQSHRKRLLWLRPNESKAKFEESLENALVECRGANFYDLDESTQFILIKLEKSCFFCVAYIAIAVYWLKWFFLAASLRNLHGVCEFIEHIKTQNM